MNINVNFPNTPCFCKKSQIFDLVVINIELKTSIESLEKEDMKSKLFWRTISKNGSIRNAADPQEIETGLKEIDSFFDN